MAGDETTTRVTLLAHLRDSTDAEAWVRFESIYREMLVRYCRCRGVQSCDADDVVQAVFMRLIAGLRRFEYDPRKGRFRAYLHRCVASALVDWRRRQPRDRAAWRCDEAELAAVGESEPPEWEREWVAHHYRLAVTELRRSVDSRAIEIFEAIVAGRQIAEVARTMGMTEQAVYKSQQRLRARLRDQIRRQIDDEDGRDHS